MRTLIFLLAGLLLLAAAAILARLFSTHFPTAASWATAAFISIWLLITVGNMWVGVAKAGYSVIDEFPIFLFLFGLPTVAALVLKWKLL